ncbi:hypothetical protein [Brevibacillus massiliensis]
MKKLRSVTFNHDAGTAAGNFQFFRRKNHMAGNCYFSVESKETYYSCEV